MDTVLIDGAARPDLAAAITRYEVRDSPTRASTCALEFVSPGPEFVWVDSPLLAKASTFSCAARAVFSRNGGYSPDASTLS